MLYKLIFPHFFSLTLTFCGTPGPAAGRLLGFCILVLLWTHCRQLPDRHSSAVSPLLGSPSPSLPSPPYHLKSNRLIEKSFAQQIVHPIQADPECYLPCSRTSAVITPMCFHGPLKKLDPTSGHLLTSPTTALLSVSMRLSILSR